ncbi:MAG: tetratricopeptide repeat protein [Anaerolineae bacterium]|jgi:soluble lytic murein transglycosylase|nr:tetratricopeptide repeat protein [Anaerolineae bacterium]MBT7073154.1 tetratricopeptide repeat protein [Anaerolineae bacterium]MBT7326620.1 tetratricopeptide repeat protein [Anaerolineae bacterium]
MPLKKFLLGLWILTILGACTLPPVSFPGLGATATASLTPSPSITPSPTPTITPSPVPTMIPLARIHVGEKALANGDYDVARAEFQAILNTTTDQALRESALWGLVRLNYEDERNHEAIAFAQQLANEYPESPFLAYAHFIAGDANRNVGRNQAATESYAAYLELRPGLLESYVEELRGDIFTEMGNFSGALNAYQAAHLAPRLDDGINLEVKVATSKASIGDYAGALADYDSITARTNSDFVKARMDYLAGYAHLMLGETEIGYARYLHTVEAYPLAYESYQALLELVAAGIPVDDFSRGLTDYAADQYDVALLAFDRYIAANPEEDGTAHYYRAKTLYALGRYDDEVAAWNDFIDKYPNHRYWTDAWEEKSYTQWADLSQLQIGKQTLLDFVYADPGNSEAPRLLMNAARLMERNDEVDEAIDLWLQLAEQYPGSNYAQEALFLAGIALYRDGDYAQSLTIFQRNLILSSTPEDQARAYLWIGKTHEKLGDVATAQEDWQQAQSINPAGYYSERARDLLMGTETFALPSIYHPEVDLATERAEAAAWLRITFNLPAGTNLEEPDALLNDLRLQRGREFWELGLYDQARLEFESLRTDLSDNAADSFRLGNYLLDLGVYRPAIFAIRQVLTLAGMESHAESLQAPAYFNHIRYGMYYSDLVEPVAEENEFHPLFIYSIMRQESLFEGFVHSAAGARGLMQVIPSTGANIARQYGWPVGYTKDDLYRPIVSVKFGIFYLNRNRALLNEDLYATLAAYNGGPGNAIEWQALGQGDPDLLLESIRFAETRNYIKFIYETYQIYKNIYSKVP